MSKRKPAAADVLNWDYMCEIGENFEKITDFNSAVKQFAWNFTSTASVQEQNEMLESMLKRATFGHSNQANEDVIESLSVALKTDLEKLRSYAKACGVRLERS